MKKILIVVAVIFSAFVISTAQAETVVGDFSNKVQENVTTTDQFTPYQNGEAADLKDNQSISKETKDRIYDLSDVRPQSKTGTVTQKDVAPSVNRQK